jgi:STAM-binding protein
LSTSQNGQDILAHLGEIKPILVDRYERWVVQHPEEAAAVRAALDAGVRIQVDSRPDRYPDHDESGWQAHEAARREAQLRREEARRGGAKRANDTLYKAVEQEAVTQHRRPQIDTAPSRKKEDALSAARRAANVSREPSLIRRDRPDRSGSEPVTPVSGEERERRRERERGRDDTRHYQEEAKRREEEEVLRRRNREQEGIMKRQQEAEVASRAARRSVVPSPTFAPAPSNHTYQYAQPPPRNGEHVYEDALPTSMPLESPTRLASSQLLSSYPSSSPALQQTSDVICERVRRLASSGVTRNPPSLPFQSFIPDTNHDHIARSARWAHSIPATHVPAPTLTRLHAFSTIHV